MLVVFARIYSKTMLVAYRDIKVNHQNVVDDISKDKAKEKLDPSYRNLDVNFTLYYIINVFNIFSNTVLYLFSLYSPHNHIKSFF